MEQIQKPYEDAYLRQRMSSIIQKQKQGKIVIAAYRDGSGLPCREDLPEIRSARYPYDYSVGDVGFLNYDSEIGGYLFTPKPDAVLPAVLAQYKPLNLGDAVIRSSDRTATILVGDTKITFTGVQAWETGYNLLRQLNEELGRVNAGVVIWKVSWAKEAMLETKRLFPGSVPTLRNGQTLVHATGYAYDEDRNLVYIGAVGYKTSLESIRATLLTNKLLTLTQDDHDVYLTPLDKYEQVWQAMPDYTSHHAGMISRPALPGKWEPEDPNAYLLVFLNAAEPKREMLRLFIERLKEALAIPILDDWAVPLWKQAMESGYIRDLSTGGDCVRGFRLALQADWRELVTQMLQAGQLALK